MTSMPDLDSIVESLQNIVDDAVVDPDTPLARLSVDSLDILDWLHALEKNFGLYLSDESIAAISPQQSVSDVYRMLAGPQA